MKLFTGGSKSITDIIDLPNRRVLDEAIYYDEEILVGDGPGADEAIQKYLHHRDYYNVTVYASGDKVRNNIGGWDVKHVSFDSTLTGDDLYLQAYVQMILDCDRAATAWDGESNDTRQNIIDLAALGKTVSNMLWRNELDEWYDTNGGLDLARFYGEDFYEKPLKLWLDDIRPSPDGYVWCKSVPEAEMCVKAAEADGAGVEIVDCDHDLGIYVKYGGDGIKLLDFLAERGTFYPVCLHTMNPVGRQYMQAMIDRYRHKK